MLTIKKEWLKGDRHLLVKYLDEEERSVISLASGFVASNDDDAWMLNATQCSAKLAVIGMLRQITLEEDLRSWLAHPIKPSRMNASEITDLISETILVLNRLPPSVARSTLMTVQSVLNILTTLEIK